MDVIIDPSVLAKQTKGAYDTVFYACLAIESLCSCNGTSQGPNTLSIHVRNNGGLVKTICLFSSLHAGIW